MQCIGICARKKMSGTAPIFKTFTQFHFQSKKLAELNDELIHFNKLFSAFLLAMQLHAECLDVQMPVVLLPLIDAAFLPDD